MYVMATCALLQLPDTADSLDEQVPDEGNEVDFRALLDDRDDALAGLGLDGHEQVGRAGVSVFLCVRRGETCPRRRAAADCDEPADPTRLPDPFFSPPRTLNDPQIIVTPTFTTGLKKNYFQGKGNGWGPTHHHPHRWARTCRTRSTG